MIIFKTPQGVSLPLFIMNFILLQKRKKKKINKMEKKKRRKGVNISFGHTK
jgi:hypothetical protein